MAEKFIYDAPQFVDFSNLDDQYVVEVYFEKDHEDFPRNGFVNGINENERDDEDAVEVHLEKDHEDVSKNGFVNSIDKSESELNQMFFTPMKTTPETSNAERCIQNRMKRSMSVGDFPEEIRKKNYEMAQDLSKNMENFNIVQSMDRKKINVKANGLKKYQSLSKLHLINKLAEPKYKASEINKPTNNYVSMAEAVSKFHTATPPRFRTTKQSKEQQPHPKETIIKSNIFMTVPQSPKLISKSRSRPVNVLSREEKEALEAEELKKYKLKIHPVNQKILQGPVKSVSVEKKPPTVPEPFKLTEMHAKKSESTEKVKVFEFHAQPVPKSLFKPIIKPALPTRATKLAFSKQPVKSETKCENKNGLIIKNNNNNNNKPKPQPMKAHKTEPKPFSFEERDKQLIKKREELVNKVLEEEKKGREFHANAIPKSVFKSPQSKCSSFSYVRRGSCESIRSHQSDDMNKDHHNGTFKARPARVLYTKPFEVKKIDRTLVEISDFQLNTDRRAKEREEFELKLKLKEEKVAKLRQKRDEIKYLQEQEEIARLRKDAEYKAQPIRQFKEVKKVIPKKLTVPVSPVLATNDRLMKNKENVATTKD